ncbi:hypothetical protein D8O27_00085 [Burkholderia mallei]|uniref:Uncharacterized protein n=2 Tax=Burkholderia mallei TaxID=13373 RepID=A2S209_BURM9|nr:MULTISPECIES: hypothetical protein [pseudomallei group]ABN00072.2 hypothetical protein BMA10229_2185 [Burkholderia mallei NCTC 10229]ABO03606.1 conserved hypothetical protein [Burkholderia mallei NCTC 10247]EDK55573.1 hypothetical protein BMAFMH_E0661 [Burkholderia mallei FMH]EDK61501.1 hypothetical protein BMAJHU_I0559 [Burkholderia mallei JHU]EDK86109.1 conserved hypothetical protein [Burkholderia mallei 2002721280]
MSEDAGAKAKKRPRKREPSGNGIDAVYAARLPNAAGARLRFKRRAARAAHAAKRSAQRSVG